MSRENKDSSSEYDSDERFMHKRRAPSKFSDDSASESEEHVTKYKIAHKIPDSTESDLSSKNEESKLESETEAEYSETRSYDGDDDYEGDETEESDDLAYTENDLWEAFTHKNDKLVFKILDNIPELIKSLVPRNRSIILWEAFNSRNFIVVHKILENDPELIKSSNPSNGCSFPVQLILNCTAKNDKSLELLKFVLNNKHMNWNKQNAAKALFEATVRDADFFSVIKSLRNNPQFNYQMDSYLFALDTSIRRQNALNLRLKLGNKPADALRQNANAWSEVVSLVRDIKIIYVTKNDDLELYKDLERANIDLTRKLGKFAKELYPHLLKGCKELYPNILIGALHKNPKLKTYRSGQIQKHLAELDQLKMRFTADLQAHNEALRQEQQIHENFEREQARIQEEQMKALSTSMRKAAIAVRR